MSEGIFESGGSATSPAPGSPPLSAAPAYSSSSSSSVERSVSPSPPSMHHLNLPKLEATTQQFAPLPPAAASLSTNKRPRSQMSSLPARVSPSFELQQTPAHLSYALPGATAPPVSAHVPHTHSLQRKTLAGSHARSPFAHDAASLLQPEFRPGNVPSPYGAKPPSRTPVFHPGGFPPTEAKTFEVELLPQPVGYSSSSSFSASAGLTPKGDFHDNSYVHIATSQQQTSGFSSMTSSSSTSNMNLPVGNSVGSMDAVSLPHGLIRRKLAHRGPQVHASTLQTLPDLNQPGASSSFSQFPPDAYGTSTPMDTSPAGPFDTPMAPFASSESIEAATSSMLTSASGDTAPLFDSSWSDPRQLLMEDPEGTATPPCLVFFYIAAALILHVPSEF